MLINLDIPKTMTNSGLLYLSKMASSIPSNGTIVEVGALFGSSTWVISKNCHPSVQIFSVDTWEKAPWISKRFPETEFPPFSIQTFKNYIQDCNNVTPLQGFSPDVVRDTWEQKIDMYFDDADHKNPGFINNLKFWLNFVKPGGIVCGDDYALGYPDIVREVDNLAKSWGVQPEIVGRVWSLRVPNENSMTSEGVYTQLPLDEVGLKLTTVFSDLQHTAPPSIWSGKLHKPGQIQALKLDWQNKLEGLDVIYYSGNDLVGLGPKVQSGSYSRPPESSESSIITQVAFKLTGKLSNQYKILYQAGFGAPEAIYDNDIKGYSNSSLHSQGRILCSPSPNIPISALRVIIEKI